MSTIKPLKISSVGVPTEINPTDDYIATKGIAFENSETLALDLNNSDEIQWVDSGRLTPKTFNSIVNQPTIPERVMDPVSPATNEVWVLNDGAGSPLGLLLAITNTTGFYKLSYKPISGAIVRVTLT